MTPESNVPATHAAPAPAPAAPARIRIWDLPTRLFHWMLVALIATLWVSAIRSWMTVHYVCGVAALVLVSFRIMWGFLGSTTARFAHFAASPGRVFAYLRALRRGDDSPHAGHNPAGGWMVLTFLLLILAQAALGLFANDEFDFKGPLAEFISGKRSNLLTRVHVFLFDAILVCIWVHVCAISFYALVKRDNLIGPMLHGTKLPARVPSELHLKFASTARALLVLVAVAGVIVFAVVYLGRVLK
ncbi:MAG TPA: cytochrome b/b6 domain-containing protein [Steroidobacteraceae bacterium]|nr:cytochrome b/b6 domain-containing protein [Steroidobacteraceae bacterium]